MQVTDDILAKAFQPFPSYTRSKVIRNPRDKKSKGYGFVSLSDTMEGAKALRAMDGKYIGNRPCKLKKSNVEARNAPDNFKKRKALMANPLDRISKKAR